MTLIGYARVSTKEQNLDRQIEELNEYGVSKIFIDQASGKNLERDGLTELRKYVRDENDTVVVSSLDRLGRNYNDVIDLFTEMNHKGVNIVVLDMPILNQDLGSDELTKMFQTIIISVLSYVADSERKKMLERQRKGIEIAKAKGKYTGRPTKYHANARNRADRIVYEKVVELLEKNTPIARISKETDLSRPTIYKIQNRIDVRK